MNPLNQTMGNYFILQGISDVTGLQAPIFLLVLLIYLFTIGGNLSILLIVYLDHHLHTPMYFFLVNLSIVDMSSTTSALNMELTSFISRNKAISFVGCMTQLYIFSSLAGVQILILTVMSYDRYVAICKPLYYSVVMNRTVCGLLATGCWVFGFMQFLPHVAQLLHFSCFYSRTINHFFCDLLPLIKLSCSDTSVIEGAYFAILLFYAVFPAIVIFTTYIFIINTILSIRSSTGRRKAFYTCSSHLTVMCVLYVTLVYQYLIPESKDNLGSNKLVSLFNTAAVPVLNPLIYSLKNKDVKSAIRRQLNRAKIII